MQSIKQVLGALAESNPPAKKKETWKGSRLCLSLFTGIFKLLGLFVYD